MSNLQSKRFVTGFGGLVLPVIMTAVANKLGVQWYMLITEACDHIAYMMQELSHSCHCVWCTESGGYSIHSTATKDTITYGFIVRAEKSQETAAWIGSLQTYRLCTLQRCSITSGVYSIFTALHPPMLVTSSHPNYRTGRHDQILRPIVAYATYLGLSSWQASSLVSVGSISLFIGQICCG